MWLLEKLVHMVIEVEKSRLAAFRLGPGKPFSSFIPSIKVAEPGKSMILL